MEKNIQFDDGKTPEQRQQLYDGESNELTYGEKMRDLQKWRENPAKINDSNFSAEGKINKRDEQELKKNISKLSIADTFKIKAQLLVEGCNIDAKVQSLFEQQNPSKVKRGGLSSGGKFYISTNNGEKILINAPFYQKQKTDIKLEINPQNNNEIVLIKDNEIISTAQIMQAPDWYGEEVDDFSITQILTQHGDQLAGSIFEDCALFSINKECEFCVINKSVAKKDPLLIRKNSDLILKALEKIPLNDYNGLILNGGMTFGKGRGMEILEPVIKKIKEKYPNLNIGIEITPPEDLDWINRLADAGINSLMMNLEIWDDEIREKIIPGKNKYCSKEQYFKAFERGIDVLGKGKVSTCFVVGTEPIESLKEGIKKVIEKGVVPSPLAGRSFEDIPNYPFKPTQNWQEFYQISNFTKVQMALEKVKTTDKAGCIACSGCDLIKNITEE